MSDKQYDETNRCTLWMQEDKKNPKAPDFSGTVNVNGTDFRLSLWKKKTNSGKKILSGSVQTAEAKTVSKSVSRPQQEESDDIPW